MKVLLLSTSALALTLAFGGAAVASGDVTECGTPIPQNAGQTSCGDPDVYTTPEPEEDEDEGDGCGDSAILLPRDSVLTVDDLRSLGIV